MKKSGGSKVKLTVIVGYAMVFIIMVIGLIALYNNLVDFSNKRIRGEDMSELLIVGNTLSLLYEVESEQNILTSEGAQQYFTKYDSIFPIIEKNLDDMKDLTTDSLRIDNLDTIKLLIDRKRDNLLLVADLLDSVRQAPRIISNMESSYVSNELNRDISEYLEEKNINPSSVSQSDTSVVVGDRKGLLDRVRNVFVANSDSTIVIESKSVVSQDEFKLIVDTIINKVRFSERLDLSRQREFQVALLKRQELMSITNRMLTSRIDNLLKEIEQEEMRKTLQLINDRENTLSRSYRIMQLVSIAGILIAMLFAILFLVDINKSQRYRKQLEASNKRISDLLEAREKLMLTISHDIKAPTGSILGFIELLNEDSGKGEEYLPGMKSSAEHVLQLVSMLLNYHKLDSGTWQLNEMNFKPDEVVKETISSFKSLALQKNLNYKVVNKLPEDAVYYGDAYVLRQVMSNLISNAIKYTVEGEVIVHAEIKGDNSEEILFFSVKDTGVGIDQNEHKYVFEEFKQLGNRGAVGQVEGSGLGLAITKGFVEELKGSINLISEKGSGSEFIVEIPLTQARHEANGLTESNKEATNLKDISAIVVDDDPVQLKMTYEMMSMLGVNCVTESDPDRVMNLLESKSFDILFFDIQMDGFTGFDLMERAEKLKGNINMDKPVIALSARSDISKSEMRELGFSDFLTKPFTSDQLRSVILKYVRNKGDNTASTAVNNTNGGVGALIEFVKDDKMISHDILDSFIEETTSNSKLLEEAFNTGDSTTAAHISHKLLPLISLIDGGKVINLMKQLEMMKDIDGDDKLFLLNSINKLVEDAKLLKDSIT